MAVTKDDTTQGAVPPIPKAQDFGFDSPSAPPGVQHFEDQYQPTIAGTQDRPYALANPAVRAEMQDVFDMVRNLSGTQGIVSASDFGYAQESLKQRVSYLPLRWVRDNPFAALQVVTSQMPGDQLREFGRSVGATWDWLNEKDPNFLVARAIAMGMPAGAIKSEVMDFLDNKGVTVAPGIPSQAAAADYLLRGPAQQLDPTSLYGRLWGLFKLPFDILGQGFSFAAGHAGSLLAKQFMSFGGVAAQGINPDFLPDEYNQWVDENFSPQEIADKINTAFGRATDLATYLPMRFGGPAIESLFGKDTDLDWSKYAWGEQPGMGLATFVADTSGLDPNSEAYRNLQEGVSFVAQWAVGAALGKFAAGFKEAGRAPELSILPEGASPEMVTAHLDYLKMRQKRLGVFGEVGYELRSKTWGQFVEGPKFNKWVADPVLELNKKFGADSAGAIQGRFPGTEVPPELARVYSLADNVDDIKLATIEYTEGKPSSLRMAADEARLTEIVDEVNTLRPPRPDTLAERFDALSADVDPTWEATGMRYLEGERSRGTGQQGLETRQLGDEPERSLIVVFRDEQGVAQGRFSLGLRDGEPYGMSIIVDPAFRGRGVAQQMIRRAVEEWGLDSKALVRALETEGMTAGGLGVARSLAGEVTSPRVRNLLSEAYQIRDRLSRPENYTPLDQPFHFPRRHNARILYNNVPNNRWGTVVRMMLNPPVRWAPHIVRLFDDMGDFRLYQPGSEKGRGLAAVENAKNVRALYDRIGVSSAETQRILGRLANLDRYDTAGWYSVVDDIFQTAAGSKLIDGAMKTRLMKFSHSAADARHRMLIERKIDADGRGTPVYEDLLFETKKVNIGGELRNAEFPLPAISAEFIGSEIHLPPIDDWIDATSWWRGWRKRAAERSPYTGELVNPSLHKLALPFDAIRSVSTGATMILKPTVLTAFGLRVPALTMRIVGEELFRGSFFGYGFHPLRSADTSMFNFEYPHTRIGGAMHRWAERKRFAADKTAAQSILEQTLRDEGLELTKVGKKELQASLKKAYQSEPMPDIGSIVFNDKWGVDAKQYRKVQMFDILPDGTTHINEEAIYGVWQRMEMLMSSPEVRNLSRLGPEAWTRWLQEDPKGRFYLDQITPNLKRHLAKDTIEAADIQMFADRLYQSINELLPESIRDALPYRNLHYRPKGFRETVQAGLETQSKLTRAQQREFADEYSRLVEEDAMLRQSVRDLHARRADKAEIQAMQQLRYDTIERLRELERLSGNKPDQSGVSRFALNDADQMVALLKDMYEQGEWKPPMEISMRGKTHATWQQSARNGFTAANRYLYDHGVFGGMKTVTAIDVRLARGRIYKLAAKEEYDRLVAIGIDPNRARMQARAKGAMVTRDILYDLSRSSSSMRYLKNVFWFGPAVQELLTTWFVKLPSRYYWPVGAALLENRAHLVINFAQQMGWMKKDENGEDSMQVPFLGHLIDKWIQGPGGEIAKDIVRFDPSNLSFLGSGPKLAGVPIPSLSTQYNAVLAAWARGQIPGVREKGNNIAEMLSDLFLPYGEDIRLGPAALNYAWTAWTGEVPPWEILSRDYQQSLYDLGADDALRQARVIVGAQPDPNDPKYEHENGELTVAGMQAWRKDNKAWQDAILAKAHDIQMGTALIRFLGATLSPTSLRVTDQYKLDAAKTLDEIYGSRGADAPVGSDAYIAWREWKDRLYDEYIAEHPGGVFYLVGKTAAGEKTRSLPYTVDEEDDFWDQFQADLFTGEKRVLPMEEYLRKAAGWESYRMYVGRLNEANEAAGIVDAPTALLNGYDRKLDNMNFQREWQTYLKLNPEFKGEYDAQRILWAQQGSAFPEQSMTSELIRTTKQLLDRLAPYFTIDGIRDKNYKIVQAELSQLLSEKGEFGPPTSDIAKGLSWYYNEVLGPYFDKIGPLIDKADAAAAAGADQSAFWDKVREINNQYANRRFVGPDGLTYAGPEEVLWSNRSPEEQDQAKLGWATKPASWLTEFQRDTVNMDLPPMANQFYTQRDAIVDAFYEEVRQRDVHPSSNEYGRMEAQRDNAIANLVSSYGFVGQQLEEWETMLPYERIMRLGLAPIQFSQLSSMAATVKGQIEAKGYSVKGWSEFATQRKVWFYSNIAAMRDESSPTYSPVVDDFFTDLGRAIPLAGKDAREGVPLYEALFFGGFQPVYIPTDIRNQFGPDYHAEGPGTAFGFTTGG